MHTGGSNPPSSEFTEAITGRVMQGAKFLAFGGGGGAGMFSALEWIMKGAVWPRASALCVCRVQDGAAELCEGEGRFAAAVLGIAERKNTLRGDEIVIIH